MCCCSCRGPPWVVVVVGVVVVVVVVGIVVVVVGVVVVVVGIVVVVIPVLTTASWVNTRLLTIGKVPVDACAARVSGASREVTLIQTKVSHEK